MKYADVMGSGATIYIQGFTKIGSDGQKLIAGRVFKDTQTAWRSHKPTLGE
jgi:hypothetical protein